MDLFDQFTDFDDGIASNPFLDWNDQSDEQHIDLDALVVAADEYDTDYGMPVF